MPKGNLKTHMKKGKILEYGVADTVCDLKRAGKTYGQIAEIINASGKLPAGETITLWTVERFLKSVPAIQGEMMRSDRRRLLKFMNRQVDIIDETQGLYAKARFLLDDIMSQKQIDPKAFKAVSSEIRALLDQLTEFQKIINSQENVQKFMEIVLETVQSCAPEVLPVVMERLRIHQNSIFSGKEIEGSREA